MSNHRRLFALEEAAWMRLALRLARRGYGNTSPNPMVGAVLIKDGQLIGQGYHRRSGSPHAEIEALADSARRSIDPRGATLYVTLEPCSTWGRTPPCTDAIIAGGIQCVVVAVKDPNPAHSGRGLRILKRAGIRVELGLLGDEALLLNEAFNHWIAHGRPWVTLKAGMTVDGKIATAAGESKWITGPRARSVAMALRRGADAVLVGVNTVLADDPRLTLRTGKRGAERRRFRIVLDSRGRTPAASRVVSDEWAASTVIVVTPRAPNRRVALLREKVTVWTAPDREGRVALRWVLRKLGKEGVASLLVEGGGEIHAAFLRENLAHRIVFFYAPRILGGRAARKAIAGAGVSTVEQAIPLEDPVWRRVGSDLLLRARIGSRPRGRMTT